METEQQNKLPFLDIAIDNSNNQLTTSVYRKPTYTDQYIQHLSHHHPQIKRAIAATLARRTNTICSPDLLQQEVDHLKTTFIKYNGCPKNLVETTIKKTLQDQVQRPPKPEPSLIRINTPYVGPISQQTQPSRLAKPAKLCYVQIVRGGIRQSPTQEAVYIN
ncbi:uncharacterized protein LOC124258017 [Haliotis rubra]|uniref:uncharacterized protein LOC124258017 n=1 Tax=Haliotis rubra TaxID=36100 RepID=UPI001EE5C99D|nr:uncharacterized protein LOC124258017 [Haliotis rubra]